MVLNTRASTFYLLLVTAGFFSLSSFSIYYFIYFLVFIFASVLSIFLFFRSFSFFPIPLSFLAYLFIQLILFALHPSGLSLTLFAPCLSFLLVRIMPPSLFVDRSFLDHCLKVLCLLP